MSVVLTLCAFCAVVSVASAEIVVGQSIAGVALGQTRAVVRHKLGAPESCAPGPCTTAKTWSYRPGAPLYQVIFNGRGHVVSVGTWRSTQHTAKGIRASMQHLTAGSTLAQIKAAYPAVKCTVHESGLWFMCNLATRRRGRTRVTFFWSSGSGHAVEIDVSYQHSA